MTAKARYDRLFSTRDPYLQRARLCSEYTIPTLIPHQGDNGATRYPTPYQSLGARGVNNLAAKLLLTLFPPNTPCFRLAISDFMLEKLTQKEGLRANVEAALSSMERAVQTTIEGSNARTGWFEAFKQLIVGGNVLVQILADGSVKVHRMDRYVVKRSPQGNVLEIIVKESISPMELPESLRLNIEKAEKKAGEGEDKAEDTSPDDTEELYTYVRRASTHYEVWQEVDGQIVPGSQGQYPLDKSPWMALRFIATDGDDYGRSYVEEYLGDLMSLEGLSKAIVEGSLGMAKMIILVNPNGTTTVKTITDAPNGAVREGKADDVTVVQMEKFGDFRVAAETAQKTAEQLSFAFLLNSAIQRNAERVTAEEIRFMAQELEGALGGIYSTMSQELQLPYVVRVMLQMERKGELPVLPKGVVKPQITTGLEALGRGNDLGRLKGFMEDLTPAEQAGAPVFQYVNVPDLIARLAAARQIDPKGLIKTPQQVQQEEQQKQAQEMAQKLGPNAINQAGGMIRDGMKSPGGAAAPSQ